MKKQRGTFSQKFKLDSTKLVHDEGYTFLEAARSLEVAETTFRRGVNQLQDERGGTTQNSKALLLNSRKFRNLKSKLIDLEVKKQFGKGYRFLNVRRDDQLREYESLEMVCSVFDVPRSSFYDFKQGVTSIKLEEL